MKRAAILKMAFFASVAVLSLTACTKDFIFDDEESLKADVTYKLESFNTDSKSVVSYLQLGMWQVCGKYIIDKMDDSWPKSSYKIQLSKKSLNQGLVIGDGDRYYDFSGKDGVEIYTHYFPPVGTQYKKGDYRYDEKNRVLNFGSGDLKLISIDDKHIVTIKEYMSITGGDTLNLKRLEIYELMLPKYKEGIIQGYKNSSEKQ